MTLTVNFKYYHYYRLAFLCIGDFLRFHSSWLSCYSFWFLVFLIFFRFYISHFCRDISRIKPIFDICVVVSILLIFFHLNLFSLFSLFIFSAYATRLDQILLRKQELVQVLRAKLHQFRQRLLEEENAFKN